MKQLLLIWAVLFTVANLFADKVILETLPPPNYLDTEVSTNIALQSYSTSHKIAIDLAFNITSSNQYRHFKENNTSICSQETLKTRFTHSFSHIKITKRGINASLQDIVIKTSPLATKVIIQ